MSNRNRQQNDLVNVRNTLEVGQQIVISSLDQQLSQQDQGHLNYGIQESRREQQEIHFQGYVDELLFSFHEMAGTSLD